MDLFFALWSLQEDPAMVREHSATYAGAWAPTVVLWEWHDTDARLRLLANAELLGPLDWSLRAHLALTAGDEPQAWAAMRRIPGSLHDDPRLNDSIEAWIAEEAPAWGLQNPRGGIAIIGADRAESRRLGRRGTQVLDSAGPLLAALGWPRWHGPLLLVMDDASHPDLPAGRDRLLRGAMPALRLDPSDARWTEALVLGCVDLLLDSNDPPAEGWPSWLHTGLREQALVFADWQRPSQHRARLHRVDTGKPGLLAALTAEDPDTTTAAALVAPLLHERRIGNLGRFLDLLRNDVDIETALRIAYDWSLDDWFDL